MSYKQYPVICVADPFHADIFAFPGWYWLNAYDPEKKDNKYIQTHTGLALPYANWGPVQPSNGYERCVVVTARTTTWNDIYCHGTPAIICEYDTSWAGG